MYKQIYLLVFLMATAMLAAAQSPGGYGTGLKLWIRADSAPTLGVTLGLIDSWTYANDNTKTFTATGTERPTLTANSINFLPTATFSHAQIMEGPNSTNAPLAAGNPDYCLFAVWRSTLVPNAASFQRVWSQRHLGGAVDNNGFALATWNDGRYGDQVESPPYDQGLLLNYTATKWNISHLNVLDQATSPSNDIEARDQTNVTGAALTGTSGITRNLSDVTNRLGARDNSTDEALQGDIAEVIVYDDPITNATVRNQVFSYLALKYGINKAGDYIASDGTTTFWNATTNAGYTNAVFGIGLDNGSALSLSRSVSVETANGDGSGQNAMGNVALSSPSSLTSNLNFLVVGHDAGALTETTANLPPFATGSQRLGRQWKVQHTGNVGTVNVDIDLTGLTITGNTANLSDFRLVIDPDGDGDFTNDIDFTASTPVYIKPTSFTGSVAHFTGVLLSNNAVFTIITSATAILPVTWKDFTAKALGNDVVLHWDVENNEQGKTYEVEHSTNGLDFAKIASVANNAQVKAYSFTHTNVAGGKHYYRIRQVDLDGKAGYSSVVDVTVKAAALSIRLLSNPVSKNYAEIEINSVASVNAGIELWSLAGQRVSVQQQGIGAGTNTLRLPMNGLPKGNYLLKINVNDIVQTLQVSKL